MTPQYESPGKAQNSGDRSVDASADEKFAEDMGGITRFGQPWLGEIVTHYFPILCGPLEEMGDRSIESLAHPDISQSDEYANGASYYGRAKPHALRGHNSAGNDRSNQSDQI